jgi:hypothetical protein
MRPPTMDPTAGERARRIHADPDIPQRISDPTDTRWGGLDADDAAPAGPVPRIVDPTDPDCGATPA